MIKVFSIISVIFFITSAIKSFAFELNSYNQVWTWSDGNGYQFLEEKPRCYLGGNDFKSSLRVILSDNARINSVPVYEWPDDRSQEISDVKIGSLVKVLNRSESGFTKVSIINNSSVLSGRLRNPIGYVEDSYLYTVENEALNSRFEGRPVQMRAKFSQLATCCSTKACNYYMGFEVVGDKSKFILSEDHNFKNLFGLAESVSVKGQHQVEPAGFNDQKKWEFNLAEPIAYDLKGKEIYYNRNCSYNLIPVDEYDFHGVENGNIISTNSNIKEENYEIYSQILKLKKSTENAKINAYLANGLQHELIEDQDELFVATYDCQTSSDTYIGLITYVNDEPVRLFVSEEGLQNNFSVQWDSEKAPSLFPKKEETKLVKEDKPKPEGKKEVRSKEAKSPHDILNSSSNKYLCINEYLTGFPKNIGENPVKLLKSTDEVLIVEDVKPITQKRGNKVDTFVRFQYKGELYWGKESVLDKSDSSTTKYIATYSECSKIQEDVLEAFQKNKLSKEAQPEKYICTDGGALNASLTKERKNEKKIARKEKVKIIHSNKYLPFLADNGHEYIRVKYRGLYYWIAEKFLSKEECSDSYTNPGAYFLGRNSKHKVSGKRLRQVKTLIDKGATVPRGMCGSYNYNPETLGGIRGGDRFIDPVVFPCFIATLHDFKKQYPTTLVQWGNISRGDRAYFPPHKSHRKGRDVDLRMIRNDQKPLGCKINRKGNASCYNRTKTRALIKVALQHGGKPIYFNDPNIYKKYKNVKYLRGHHNHIHIRYSRSCPKVTIEERICPRKDFL